MKMDLTRQDLALLIACVTRVKTAGETVPSEQRDPEDDAVIRALGPLLQKLESIAYGG